MCIVCVRCIVAKDANEANEANDDNAGQLRQNSRWIIIDDGNAMLMYTWKRATTDYSYIYAGNR